MPKGWNKGHTKHTHASVRKISETMKHKKIDNFARWRESAKKEGRIATPKSLKKNGDLAELIGMIHGDGSIHKYERTEGLRIVLPTKRPKLISHYEKLIERVFSKKPSVLKRKTSACVNLNLYQKDLSSRLEIPSGARGELEIVLPDWIMKNENFVIRYLRGLYEAEGSHCVHLATYTHKLIFTNKNKSILDIVFSQLKRLGFHPHISGTDIQISRKEEVAQAIELLQFRKY